MSDGAELTAPVPLTRPDGSLDPRAIGWARRSVHDATLRGPFGRQKRWDYWCVTTETCALQLTIADLDYLGLVDVSFVDLASGVVASAPWATPLGLGVRLGPAVSSGFSVRTPISRVSSETLGGDVGLEVRAWTPRGRVVASVRVRGGDDSLDVVVPWSDRTFQLTSKHVGRRAEGEIRALGRRWEVSGATSGFGCLDFGRGVWPAETTWNWGAGAGRAASGERVGLQLGGKWTDGTGATENGVFLDGRLEKIHDELVWAYDLAAPRAPWRVTGGGLDLTFAPDVVRRQRIELGVGRSALHLAFGRWSGAARVGGRALALEGLIGWAEEHRARW